jgi:hypothetical protein
VTAPRCPCGASHVHLTLEAVRAFGFDRGSASADGVLTGADWNALDEHFGKEQTFENGLPRADVHTEYWRGFREGASR